MGSCVSSLLPAPQQPRSPPRSSVRVRSLSHFDSKATVDTQLHSLVLVAPWRQLNMVMILLIRHQVHDEPADDEGLYLQSSMSLLDAQWSAAPGCFEDSRACRRSQQSRLLIGCRMAAGLDALSLTHPSEPKDPGS